MRSSVRRYTRLTFLGRGPLCGIGVVSLIDFIFKPLDRKDLTDASLPEPTPRTNISTLNGPLFAIFSKIASATLPAANGVDFFGPENPSDPAESHVITLPLSSVTVIIVLL